MTALQIMERRSIILLLAILPNMSAIVDLTLEQKLALFSECPGNFSSSEQLLLSIQILADLVSNGITLTPGDIEIGAVELKDASSDARAKIAVLSSLVAGDIGLGVTDPVANAILGVISGSAVVTDANGTIQQYLRGLVKALIPVLGATADAAVDTDANGSINAHIRGIVKLLVAGIGVTGPLTDAQLRAALVPVLSSDAGGMSVSWGITGVPFTSADASAAPVAVTDAPTSGQKLVFTDLIISSDTALTLTFTEETTTTVIRVIHLAAGSTANIINRGKRKLATANKKLLVQASVAGNIVIEAGYYSEA